MEKDLAILIADLTGYTAMTEVHGGDSASKIVDRYIQLVESSLMGESYLAERIGDQVVVCSTVVDDLAATALQLNELTKKENLFLPIHAGIHYGKIVEKEGRFFGSTINIAARIAATAKAGEVRCSESFAWQLKNTNAYQLIDLGHFEFKNFSSKVKVFRLLSPAPNEQDQMRDPICQMLIVTPEEALRYKHQDKAFYFCSDHCLSIFKQANPPQRGVL
ncbi:adenylate/guanylate cyclase domain-containing protein [uncultured Roseivirga sp.]|uniref:adenylate/guanylate cyclase domain-containing protein n=1 Tax=uncultured Roseivirga sp. TaxID=543088 RepID=UPI0030D728D3|tara:strand:+ start:197546 stop:198202 length:657 start_codon:yes stop_codon:yes gene_type:complete